MLLVHPSQPIALHKSQCWKSETDWSARVETSISYIALSLHIATGIESIGHFYLLWGPLLECPGPLSSLERQAGHDERR